MKIAPKSVATFLKNPPNNIQSVLIYGPDAGLISNRAKQLSSVIVEDITDPFSTIVLNQPLLNQDNSKLYDEVAALNLVGGRRLITITDAGNTLTPLLKDLLSAPPGDAFIIVIAGDLPASSSLRKLYEKLDNAASLACYKEEGATLQQSIRSLLGQSNFTIDNEALYYLEYCVSGDYLIMHSEINKLLTYKGDDSHITLQDVESVISSTNEYSLDDLSQAIASGQFSTIEAQLQQATREHIAPITVIRAISRYFLRLQLAKYWLTQGQSLDQALKQLRPPVFFKQAPAFKKHLSSWSLPQLASVIATLTQLEKQCKQSHMPADLLYRHIATILPFKRKQSA